MEFVTHGVTPQERHLIRDPPRGHGILGLLIRDRSTYDNLNATMAQANAAICDIRAITGDPSIRAKIRYILDNIATLSDKLARDPSRVIRGVVNRDTPIK